MLSEQTLRDLILVAVADGRITSADLPDATEFEDISEYLEYCGKWDLHALAVEHELIAKPRDIHEVMDESMRRRARWAGIRGA